MKFLKLNVRGLPALAGLLFVLLLSACTTVVTSVGSGVAGNLSAAILNQDDPELVRDGAPAYLLMLDSFVEGAPDSAPVLGAAAELYSAYGVVFVDDPERARKLTTRARAYGQRGLCASEEVACKIWDLPYPEFVEALQLINDKHVAALYSFGLSWIAYIQAHSDDYSALAKLPQVTATLERVREMDAYFKAGDVEKYLGFHRTDTMQVGAYLTVVSYGRVLYLNEIHH